MLKRRNPSTPGQRGIVLRKNTEGRKYIPLGLRKGKKEKSGRNNIGKITVYHRGGGHKKRLRDVIGIHKTSKERRKGEVRGIQYDPNRTGRLALVKTEKYEYFLAGESIKVGSMITYNDESESDRLRSGSIYKLKKIPVGHYLSNLESIPGKGSTYIRSAGTKGLRIRKINDKALIRLPSNKRIELSLNCMAIFDTVKGEDHKLEVLGKAGRSRNMGIRPCVRGEAINPVDHPHGGRTRGGRFEITPWGKLAKGVKTKRK